MTAPRLSPPFWRHDAYTLNKLARKVGEIAKTLRDGPSYGGLSRGDTVVDFGAGAAPYRALFEGPGIRYVTCDLGDGAEVTISLGQPIPLEDQSAKVVVSFQVLEHVWDLDWYLLEARRLLMEDGALVLSTHGTWLYHPHPTDFRRWTRDGLVAELTTRGFVVQEIVGLVGPLAWTTQFRALGFHRLLSAVPLIGPTLAAVMGTVLNLRMWVEDRVTPAEWTDTNAAVYVVVARKAA